MPEAYHRRCVLCFQDRILCLSVHLYFLTQDCLKHILALDPCRTDLCGPIFQQGLGAHPVPSCRPATPQMSRAETSGGRRSAGRGGVRTGSTVWLTCLATPGNSCSGKVLDFLVLLQKTLQKLGSFWHSNSKARSKALLPCMDRNAQDQRRADRELQLPGGGHRAPASPQKGPWKTLGPAPVGTTRVSPAGQDGAGLAPRLSAGCCLP